MHARKWLSNSTEVLADIPPDDRSAQVSLDSGTLPSIKTLGVLWVAENDTFSFCFVGLTQSTQLTKRLFLKKIATIFDPLGLLAPFIVRAKVLFQDIWLAGYDWDDPLSDALSDAAQQWFDELPDFSQIQIPRCLQDSSIGIRVATELHIFVDASEKAYGAVAYLALTYANGERSSRMVIMRTGET